MYLMEYQILIDSMIPWSALYFVITPPPTFFLSWPPSQDNEGGGTISPPKYEAQFWTPQKSTWKI